MRTTRVAMPTPARATTPTRGWPTSAAEVERTRSHMTVSFPSQCDCEGWPGPEASNCLTYTIKTKHLIMFNGYKSTPQRSRPQEATPTWWQTTCQSCSWRGAEVGSHDSPRTQSTPENRGGHKIPRIEPKLSRTEPKFNKQKY
jgi:hypothetical protein